MVDINIDPEVLEILSKRLRETEFNRSLFVYAFGSIMRDATNAAPRFVDTYAAPRFVRWVHPEFKKARPLPESHRIRLMKLKRPTPVEL